jgi:signal transduction histidine kinase
VSRRLLVSYLTITVVVLVLLEVPLAVFYGQRERERTSASLEHDASVIATVYEDDLEAGRRLDPLPAETYRTRTGARVVVVDGAGISQVDTDQQTDRDFSSRPEFQQALAGNRASGTRSSDTLGTDFVYVALPVASGGTVHGALRVTLDTSDVTARIHRFWLALVAIAVIVIATVALLGWVIARSATRPIRQLTTTAGRFAQGDLAVNGTTITGPTEVRALAETLVTMARRLDALLRAQRSFVADASHQLRTPLTALRLRLENLQTDVQPEIAGELDAAIDETTRLADLVSNLLQLARADHAASPTVVDLVRLTAERIDTWQAAADAKGVTLSAELPDAPVPVASVPGAIEQILDNLLDNALNASPEGATIATRVASSDGDATLTITDQGPGLTDEQKAMATQRFWRASPGTPGSGLGLAIVESLTTASRGRLELADAPGSGLSVVVAFRTAPRSDARSSASDRVAR